MSKQKKYKSKPKMISARYDNRKNKNLFKR